MGPGYFPMICSALLVIIGLVVCLKSVTVETPDGDPIGSWNVRPMVFIILANMLFGILLEGWPALHIPALGFRSEEHTSELQSLMRISYAVFCLKKKKII